MTTADQLRAHHWAVQVDSTSVPLGEVLRRMRNLLPPEQEVIGLLLGLDGIERTVGGVARELGLTNRQTRAIADIGFSKLRHPSTGG